MNKTQDNNYKIDDIKILYDKNGCILNNNKLKIQIKNLIYELEEQYNLTDLSDELRLQDLSSKIINLKIMLKKIELLKHEREEKNNSNNMDSKLVALSKSIDIILNDTKVSFKEKLSNVEHILKELNELYESTMFLNEDLNSKINDLIIKINHYKTNMLKLSVSKIRKNNETKIIDFKIIYDANLGYYKFEYCLIYNGKREEGTKLYQMDKYLLEDVTGIDTRIIEKYGYETDRQIDTNLYVSLGEFDKIYNTNMQEKYAKNQLQFEIMYDLRKFSKNLNSYDKKKIKELAKNQQKQRNAKLVRFPYAKAASVAAAASIVGTMIFSPIIKNITRNDKKQYSNYEVASYEYKDDNSKSLSLKI